MAHYYVKEVKDGADQLLGWAVCNLDGVQVAGLFPTQSAAEQEANTLEASRQDILQQAAKKDKNTSERIDGGFSGPVLAYNDRFLLICAGRGNAAFVPRKPVDEADIEWEIDEIVYFEIRDGIATNRKRRLGMSLSR
ncbi:hypothetical protein LH433_02550 [Laribacter hongkongensis]|uniref:hypothetical protein n=1 Tax=Laribacter hongkongensis TaxID=168471 RepID=UPI001EFD9867|nr:hypothetical protein [Laribacter hongkongensis]MCG9105637.1 hypothetical protein [Laribacter hongkongensis]